MDTHYTTDGVAIVEGLMVWTNSLRRARITLARSWVENGELWFNTIDPVTGYRSDLQSESRVGTRHPRTGEKA